MEMPAPCKYKHEHTPARFQRAADIAAEERLAKMKPRHVPKPGLIRGAIVDALALVGFFALMFAFLRVTGGW